VLVEVVTDAGITGVGEAAVTCRIGGTVAAGMTKDLIQAMLLGRGPDSHRRCCDRIRRSAATKKRDPGGIALLVWGRLT
jgi:galactonate dehydratase